MLVEAARPNAIRNHPWAGWFAVGSVCFGAFMGQLDASIVTLTFPELRSEFGEPLAAIQWVSLAYLLTLVALVAGAGRLADALGRKALYLWGFAIFTVASAACGLATSLSWLIVFRVIQAAGAALLQSNSVALVVHSVAPHQTRQALGIQAAAQALGLALGPAIGGVLVASAGWQWVFWVNLPVGVVALVAGHYLLPRTRQFSPLGRFDVPGLALLSLASVAMLLALSGLSGLDLMRWQMIALGAVAAGSGWLFLKQERRSSSPLIELSVLRPLHVRAGLIGALAAYAALFGPLVLFPQILEQRGVDGQRIGLLLTALPIGFAGLALLGERILPRRWSVRARLRIGAWVSTIGAGLLAVVGSQHLPTVAVLLFVTGAGLGIFIPANNATVMGAIPARLAAVGGGLVNMARGMGTALGVALVTFTLHAAGGSTTVDGRSALAALTLAGVVVLVSTLGASAEHGPAADEGALEL